MKIMLDELITNRKFLFNFVSKNCWRIFILFDDFWETSFFSIKLHYVIRSPSAILDTIQEFFIYFFFYKYFFYK